METAAHQTLTADSCCSYPKDLTKHINVQLKSPDTSPSSDIGDVSNGTLEGSTTPSECQTDLNGSFLDHLLSPASERQTPGELRSNRFSRNGTPECASSLNPNSSQDVPLTEIDYQSLPSPPELYCLNYVDPDFEFNLQSAFDISRMRHNFRIHKYGDDAFKYKRGFTPSPLRRAYTERQEEGIRRAAFETTDSESSTPSPHPADSNGEAGHHNSETFQESNITSSSGSIKRSGEETLLPEAQIPPQPMSLPASSDVALEREDPALRAILNQQLDQRAGSKRSRDDADDGSTQEELPDICGDSVKERPHKRRKYAPR